MSDDNKKEEKPDAGYGNFPYRSEEVRKADQEKSFWSKVWTGRENKKHVDCESRVQWCVKNGTFFFSHFSFN